MATHEKDDGSLPSYEDSVDPLRQTHFSSRGQQILDRLALVRAQHLRSLIDDQIIPIVEQQALYGIAQTTIAMIPSDINLPVEEEAKSEFGFDAANNEKKVDVVGFSSDHVPQIITLEGQINRTEFWRDQAIVIELERVLRESLNASLHLQPSKPQQSTARQSYQKPPKSKIFGRRANAVGQELPFGGQTAVEPENVAQVLVRARLEEVCLRTVNEFGLYDTMSKQCVVVSVDARC
ncbi:hypothetical protein EJ04DRAFT_517383 [Polyplosphaeria fusca]|uniref:Uncharacterized protein n=1 Tax=Polyplosphaeria fusca TaxID=682080 RepID=A0A9P4USY8_9PLEO|nr:hypothetical protein EJ04DRAFT_517383 [Polyplosphaeria fusca]